MKALLDLEFKMPCAIVKYPINLNYIKKCQATQTKRTRDCVLFSQATHSPNFLSCKINTSGYICNLQRGKSMCCFSSCCVFQQHVVKLHVLYPAPLGCVMYITIRSQG